ncbi:TetR/AcrR family transcriptional regulator [Hymenobacter canadensis]|uniref:Helix-turn-helix domain containing protein n=1 Tax=Hymenobacter canadensis TaxID=2999067 RepID=A0ABY7LRC7_9BACT|nr:TetR/AcrR family transcriptional regulator [Hymenobacter canadensis]WBA42491.1 helix-turn-helix domain containing protein [Hymenobacter canadensis]
MKSYQRIEQTALQLFADRGYDHTSTALIAKEAGVSEPLIFKYFQSKDKLFESIIKDGYKRIVEANRGMLTEDDASALVQKVIDLPYKLVREERAFWTLQDKAFDKEVVQKHFQKFMLPVYALLNKAFIDLGYAQPDLATYHLTLLVQALWRQLLHEEDAEILNRLNTYIKRIYTHPGLADLHQ